MVDLFKGNYLIKAVALGFILLGFYYFLGLGSINTYTILCFSVSGFLFIISDFCGFKSNQYSRSKNNKKRKAWMAAQVATSILAVLFIVLFPYVNIKVSDENMEIFINTSLLLGLGLTIWLIASKSEREYDRFLDRLERIVTISNSHTEEMSREMKKNNDV